MRKSGTEQHFFTVRGRGFDHKQWRAVTELAEGVVRRANDAGITADFEADARRIIVSSPEEGVSPLVIWRKGEPGIPKEVSTRGQYDAVVQSVLTAAKKVAPDIFVMTSPDGRDYRRLLAKKKDDNGDFPEIKEIAKKNRELKDRAFMQSVKRQKWPNPNYQPGTKAQQFVEFVSTPKEEQTKIRRRWDAEYGHRYDAEAERAIQKVRETEKSKTEATREKAQAEDAAQNKQKKPASKEAQTMTKDPIYRAAIRVAHTTDDKNLKMALLEILRGSGVLEPKEAKEVEAKEPEPKEVEAKEVEAKEVEAKDDKEKEKESRHEEGKSVDVGDYLKEKGHDEDSAKWETHEGDMGKKSSAAVVFPEVYALARQHVLEYSKTNPESKTASGSTADRVTATDHLAKKWIQDAIKRPGRVHEYLGVPEGDDIPMGKIDTAIEKVKGTGNKSLLSALQLAKRLKGMKKKKAGDDKWLNEESFTKAATEVWGEERIAKEWVQAAIQRHAALRGHLEVSEGEDIPMAKLSSAIQEAKTAGDKGLLSSLLLAKRLKGKMTAEAA